MNNADMPAMPCKQTVNRDSGEMIPFQFGNNDFVTPGLTKREEFAKAAMQGFLANAWEAETLDSLGECSSQQMATVAEISCVMADALLKALEESK